MHIGRFVKVKKNKGAKRMWKRQDDGADAQLPKVTSKDMFETPEMSLESARRTLIEVCRDTQPRSLIALLVLRKFLSVNGRCQQPWLPTQKPWTSLRRTPVF